MADISETAELDQLRGEIRVLRAQVTEGEALIGFLRQRNVLLDNEVQHRDSLIVERDQMVASLTQQLAQRESDPADQPMGGDSR